MSSTITVSELKELLKNKQDVSIVDVRRKADYDADKIIPGSLWRDPEKAQEWMTELPKDKELVIYCVRGGSVSKSVSEQLMKHQIPVRYVEGGLAAWEADIGEKKI